MYAEPSRDWASGAPPGELTNDKETNGTPTNLSTTPSSLQIMLKLSPAVGIPGIVISGMNRYGLSATHSQWDFTIMFIHWLCLTFHSQLYATAATVLQHMVPNCGDHCDQTGDEPVIITWHNELVDMESITSDVVVSTK